ncbi:MAG: DUF4406 domain-containing protein [Flavobacteriaceae bacterium]
MKKKIYIAGKVTGLPQKEVVEKFEEAQLEIEKQGFYAVNPLEVVGDWNCDWQTAMKRCITALLKCDEAWFLPCWSNSKGALLEHKIATEVGIETKYYSDI